MNVSLRQLIGFLTVAKTGSFTRSAETLLITQSGLSAMMRELESQLDCRLFDRTTRSLELTREGQHFLPYAEDVVARLEEARVALRGSTRAARRVLTIAVSPIFAALVAPEVCRIFRAQHPHIDVRILDVPRQELQATVERREADIGFGIFEKQASSIQLTPLLQYRLVYIASAGTVRRAKSAAAPPALAWSRLPDLPLITLTPDLQIQSRIDEIFASRAITPRRAQACNNMQTAISLVAQGFGATILPSLVLPACPRERFDVARLVEPEIDVTLYQITKKGRAPNPAAMPFTKTMTEVARRLSTNQP